MAFEMMENWEQYKDLEYYPDRVCACGCGGRIKVKSHHRWYGIPKFIKGHQNRGRPLSIKNKTYEEIYGIEKAQECRLKQSEAQIRNWQDPEFVKKILKTSSPNKPEKFIIGLLQKLFPNQWKYVGDGQFALAGKNPDFINVNGQRKLLNSTAIIGMERKGLVFLISSTNKKGLICLSNAATKH